MSIAKSAKAYNREAGPTVTVTASDAAVTAAYKRGLKEGTVAAYKRGLDRGANNAHAAAAEIIARTVMKWFVGKEEHERVKAEAYNRGYNRGWDQGSKDCAAAGGIPSRNDECTVGIYSPPPPKPMTRAEAMKLVREAMTRTNIVADTVGTDINGGFGDSWALGQVLVLEALGVLKVSS